MMRAGAPGAVGGGEERRQPTPHRVVNPEGLAPPVGFAHAVVATPADRCSPGRAGRPGADGVIRGRPAAEQFDVAAGNLVLTGRGGVARHLVSLHIYTSEVDDYRATRGEGLRRLLPPPPGPPLCGHGPVRGSPGWTGGGKVGGRIAVVPDPEPEEHP
jgi:hypothetical protein